MAKSGPAGSLLRHGIVLMYTMYHRKHDLHIQWLHLNYMSNAYVAITDQLPPGFGSTVGSEQLEKV